MATRLAKICHFHVVCALSMLAVIFFGQIATADTPATAPPAAQVQVPAFKVENRFPQPVRVGSLLQRIVLQPLESQPKLGRVTQVVQRLDGMIEIVMQYGGFLGFRTRTIAVPLEAMTLLGEYMEVVGFTPEQLDRFASFDNNAVPLSPDMVIKVGLSKPSH